LLLRIEQIAELPRRVLGDGNHRPNYDLSSLKSKTGRGWEGVFLRNRPSEIYNLQFR
jgi:hypothetical protein